MAKNSQKNYLSKSLGPRLGTIFFLLALALAGKFILPNLTQNFKAWVSAAGPVSATLNNGATTLTFGNDLTSQITGLDTDTAVYKWTFGGTSIFALNWPMNSGATQTDFSGGANDGTVTGATYTDSCKIGGCFSFAGGTTNNRIESATTSAGTITKGSVFAWIKTSNAGTSYREIISKDGWNLYLKDNIFIAYQGGDRSTGVNLANNAWHQVGMTLNSGVTNGSKVYIDGSSVLTTTITTSTATLFRVGVSTASTQYFGGLIDEVQVYNRILSDTQITQLYNDNNAGNGGPTTIKNAELSLAPETWNLVVTPISAGTVGSAITSSNTVTTNLSTLTGSLNAANDGTYIMPTFTVPNGSTVIANSWVKNSSNFMVLNMPFNGFLSNGSTIKTIKDYSGSGNDGTIGGTAGYTTSGCKIGGCLTNDAGTNSRVDVPNASNLQITGDMTISAWVKFAALTGYRVLVGKGGTGGATRNYWLWLTNDSPGRIGFQQYTSGAVAVFDLRGVLAPRINTWYHVAGVKSGSTATVYVNGLFDATATASGTPTTTTDQLTIGSCSNCTGLSGNMDDVGIFPSALSASQIYQLYKEGLGSGIASTDGVPIFSTISAADATTNDVWQLFAAEQSTSSGAISPLISIATVTVATATSSSLNITPISSPQSENVTVNFTCINGDNTPRDILIQYSTDGGSTLIKAALTSASTGTISESMIQSAACDGSTQSFVWNTLPDYAGGDAVRIKLTEQSPAAINVQSNLFSVNNPSNLNGSVTSTDASTNITTTINVPAGSLAAYHWLRNGNHYQVLNMPFNSESTQYDLSGNGYVGYVMGLPGNGFTNTGCKTNGCLILDGTSGYVMIPDATNLRPTGDFAVSFWMKKNSEASGWASLIAKSGASATSRNYTFLEESGSAKRILFIQSSSTGSTISSIYSTTLTQIGTWYHVVGQRSSSAATCGFTPTPTNPACAQIYINGLKELSSAVGNATPVTTLDPVKIGKDPIYGYFPGYIDDLIIFPKAISPGQINQLYTDGNNNSGGPTMITPADFAMNDTWTLLANELTSAGTIGNTTTIGSTVIVDAGPTTISVTTPTNPLQGNITINYTCTNAAGSIRSILVQYSNYGSNGPYNNATVSGATVGGTNATINGSIIQNIPCDGINNKTLLWNSAADLSTDVRIKLTLQMAGSPSAETADFVVNNPSNLTGNFTAANQGMSLSPAITIPNGSLAGYRWLVNGSPYQVLNMPFNSGTTQRDLIGGSTGSIVNGPTFVTSGCKIGGCMSFDGLSGFISVPDQPSLKFTGDYTISLWLKKTQSSSGWAVPLTKGVGATRNYGIWIEPGGKRLYFTGFGSASFYSTTSPAIGTWYHVVAVRKAPLAYIYVDNILESFTSTSGTPVTSAEPINIGSEGPSYSFTGYIDELGLYPRALSESQIAQLYNEGLAGLSGPQKIMVDQHSAGQTWKLTAIELMPTGTLGVATDIGSATLSAPSATTLVFLPLNGNLQNNVTVNYTCTNADSSPRDIAVQYSLTGASDPFLNATLINSSSAGIAKNIIQGANCNGSSQNFVWDTVADHVSDVKLKITELGGSNSTTTNNFVVNNSSNVTMSLANRIAGKAISTNAIFPASSTVGYRWRVNNSNYMALDLPFNSGLKQIDISGQGNNGTLGRPAAYTNTDCKVGGCLNFNGAATEFVAFPPTPPASLNLTQGSVFAWIKTPDAGAGFRGIVVKQNAYGMYFWSNLFSLYDFGGSGHINLGINLADNTWHHVGFTFKSGLASGTKVYIDGNLVLTTKITVSNQLNNVAVGAGNNPPTYQFFKGLIDEVQIYPRILSHAQIRQIYLDNNNGSGAPKKIVLEEQTDNDNWTIQGIEATTAGLLGSFTSSITTSIPAADTSWELSKPAATPPNGNVILQGPPGPAGPKGPQGVPGPQGTQGPVGIANCSLSTATCAAGANANCTIINTPINGSAITHAQCQSDKLRAVNQSPMGASNLTCQCTDTAGLGGNCFARIWQCQ